MMTPMDAPSAAVTVSVIMPAYNAAVYIEAAIRSVMAQTFTDWELLVIDDGSTDATCAVVEGLMAEDARIRLLRNEHNCGVAVTRNRGLDICRGAYVALLDCDDLWYPEKLAQQLAVAADGADIVYCSYAMVDEQGAKLCDDFIVPSATDYRASMIRSVISCSTALLSRRVVDNYRFNPAYYHEDCVLWLELLRDGYVARGVPAVLAAYRISRGSRASNKVKAAIERWRIIRGYMHEPFFSAVGILIRYALLALRKYKKTKECGGGDGDNTRESSAASASPAQVTG